jgi:hypothetical protein
MRYGNDAGENALEPCCQQSKLFPAQNLITVPWKNPKESIHKEKRVVKFARKPRFWEEALAKSRLKTYKAKNLYRKDAKYAKKHQTSSDFLSSFALFASSRWECFYSSKILYWGEVLQLTGTQKLFGFLNCLGLIWKNCQKWVFQGRLVKR